MRHGAIFILLCVIGCGDGDARSPREIEREVKLREARRHAWVRATFDTPHGRRLPAVAEKPTLSWSHHIDKTITVIPSPPQPGITWWVVEGRMFERMRDAKRYAKQLAMAEDRGVLIYVWERRW